jgi:protein-tyrosine phosphatase
MQVNASSLLTFITRSKIIKMMRAQAVHCIGSDCHNTTTRAPKIGKAFEVVEKKLGSRFVEKINDFGHYLVD